MENESLVRNIFKWNVKSHQNVHKVPQSWDVTDDRAFSIWINLQVLLWFTTYQLSTSQLDRSDKLWAIMGVTQQTAQFIVIRNIVTYLTHVWVTIDCI